MRTSHELLSVMRCQGPPRIMMIMIIIMILEKNLPIHISLKQNSRNNKTIKIKNFLRSRSMKFRVWVRHPVLDTLKPRQVDRHVQ